uniref:Uncharacterized protein n=1 Tax=Ascaris lumbricoides TaxID=6252 RepID=A0A9J2Q198_ASCLU
SIELSVGELSAKFAFLSKALIYGKQFLTTIYPTLSYPASEFLRKKKLSRSTSAAIKYFEKASPKLLACGERYYDVGFDEENLSEDYSPNDFRGVREQIQKSNAT